MTNLEIYALVKAKNGGDSSGTKETLKALIDRSITSIDIPRGVTNIGTQAFNQCKNLTSVTIPDSVTRIEQYAFYNCTNLKSVIIPDAVTSIGKEAFRGCITLSNVTIPNSVTSIYDLVFLNCARLENVIVGNGFNADNLNLSVSTLYSVDTMIAMFNALADRTGQTAYTLTLGDTNLAKLSNEEIAIATQKNWTLA